MYARPFPSIVIVAEFPLIDYVNPIPSVATNTSCEPTVPEVPDVLPMFDIPAENPAPPPAATERIIVFCPALAAFVIYEIVIFPEPYRITSLPVNNPDVPRVFPRFEIPTPAIALYDD